MNWSDVTWSPCFAACRTASVMASAWAGVNSASVSARATACVSQHAPQLSPKTPPPKGCNCDADDELTGRVPVAADDELSARRERHDAVVRRGVRRGRTARLPLPDELRVRRFSNPREAPLPWAPPTAAAAREAHR